MKTSLLFRILGILFLGAFMLGVGYFGYQAGKTANLSVRVNPTNTSLSPTPVSVSITPIPTEGKHVKQKSQAELYAAFNKCYYPEKDQLVKQQCQAKYPAYNASLSWDQRNEEQKQAEKDYYWCITQLGTHEAKKCEQQVGLYSQ
jgi:hypothetical protein